MASSLDADFFSQLEEVQNVILRIWFVTWCIETGRQVQGVALCPSKPICWYLGLQSLFHQVPGQLRWHKDGK
jgi:hypothetical protein